MSFDGDESKVDGGEMTSTRLAYQHTTKTTKMNQDFEFQKELGSFQTMPSLYSASMDSGEGKLEVSLKEKAERTFEAQLQREIDSIQMTSKVTYSGRASIVEDRLNLPENEEKVDELTSFDEDLSSNKSATRQPHQEQQQENAGIYDDALGLTEETQSDGSNDDYGFRATGKSGYSGIADFRRKRMVEKKTNLEQEDEKRRGETSSDDDESLLVEQRRRAMPRTFQLTPIEKTTDHYDLNGPPMAEIFLKQLEDMREENEQTVAAMERRIQEQKEIAEKVRNENNMLKSSGFQTTLDEMALKHEAELRAMEKTLLDIKIEAQELKIENHKLAEEKLDLSVQITESMDELKNENQMLKHTHRDLIEKTEKRFQDLMDTVSALQGKSKTLESERDDALAHKEERDAFEVTIQNQESKIAELEKNSKDVVQLEATIKSQETKMRQTETAATETINYWKGISEKRTEERNSFESSSKNLQLKIDHLEEVVKLNSNWKDLAEERLGKLKSLTAELQYAESKNSELKTTVETLGATKESQKAKISQLEMTMNETSKSEELMDKRLHKEVGHWKKLSEELLEKTNSLMTKLGASEAATKKHQADVKKISLIRSKEKESFERLTKDKQAAIHQLIEKVELNSNWKQLAEERMCKIQSIGVLLKGSEEKVAVLEEQINKKKNRFSIRKRTSKA